MYANREILDCLADLNDLGLEADPANTDAIAAALRHVLTAHKAGYDGDWSRLQQAVTGAIRWTEGGGLTEVLARIEHQRGNRTPEPLDPFIGQQIKVDLAGFADAPPYHKLVARNGRYELTAHPAGYGWTADLIRPFVTAETDAIVEFGGGWGRNLAHLARDLPPGRRRLINCEQSAHGRAASEALMARAPGTVFQAREFHFEAPVVDFLGGCRNVLAFTSADIAQPGRPREAGVRLSYDF